MTGTQLSNLLRQATRDAHRMLDHHPLLAPLTSKTLTQECYARALSALHGPQSFLEARLSSFAPSADFPARLPDLIADLEALGTQPFPLLSHLPETAENAGLIGSMYVIEGSNLGARVIDRCIADSLPDVPRRFFGSRNSSERWQRFWIFADSKCPIGDAQVAVEAAVATFAWYRQHLDTCLND